MKKKYESPSVRKYDIEPKESYLIEVSGVDGPGGGSTQSKDFEEDLDDFEW